MATIANVIPITRQPAPGNRNAAAIASLFRAARLAGLNPPPGTEALMLKSGVTATLAEYAAMGTGAA